MNRLESTWLDQIRRRGDGVEDARVLVACSGGGDSVALLAFLWSVRRSLRLELTVAHADHGLRPESEADAAFVRDLCRRLDLDLAEARLDVKRYAESSGEGLEMAARHLRWAWLKEEAAATGASWVATGHTQDDHTETVLVRLARGSGLGCLTPLPARQAPRWSPLIEARRADLRDYLRQLGLPWREDSSNDEGFTPRNRIRRHLEALRSEAPAFDRHLWETHAQVAELRAFRDRLVAGWRGDRWEFEPGALHLRGPIPPDELRWILEGAFREAGWLREAELLRGLAAWASPHLARRSRKAKTWGGWRLEAAPSGPGWRLFPEPSRPVGHPRDQTDAPVR